MILRDTKNGDETDLALSGDFTVALLSGIPIEKSWWVGAFGLACIAGGFAYLHVPLTRDSGRRDSATNGHSSIGSGVSIADGRGNRQTLASCRLQESPRGGASSY